MEGIYFFCGESKLQNGISGQDSLSSMVYLSPAVKQTKPSSIFAPSALACTVAPRVLQMAARVAGKTMATRGNHLAMFRRVGSMFAIVGLFVRSAFGRCLCVFASSGIQLFCEVRWEGSKAIAPELQQEQDGRPWILHIVYYRYAICMHIHRNNYSCAYIDVFFDVFCNLASSCLPCNSSDKCQFLTKFQNLLQFLLFVTKGESPKKEGPENTCRDSSRETSASTSRDPWFWQRITCNILDSLDV